MASQRGQPNGVPPRGSPMNPPMNTAPIPMNQGGPVLPFQPNMNPTNPIVRTFTAPPATNFVPNGPPAFFPPGVMYGMMPAPQFYPQVMVDPNLAQRQPPPGSMPNPGNVPPPTFLQPGTIPPSAVNPNMVPSNLQPMRGDFAIPGNPAIMPQTMMIPATSVPPNSSTVPPTSSSSSATTTASSKTAPATAPPTDAVVKNVAQKYMEKVAQKLKEKAALETKEKVAAEGGTTSTTTTTTTTANATPAVVPVPSPAPTPAPVPESLPVSSTPSHPSAQQPPLPPLPATTPTPSSNFTTPSSTPRTATTPVFGSTNSGFSVNMDSVIRMEEDPTEVASVTSNTESTTSTTTDRFASMATGRNWPLTPANIRNILDPQRIAYEKEHGRKKFYSLDELRSMKDNVRSELINHRHWPEGMKRHKLLPLKRIGIIPPNDPILVAQRTFRGVLNKLSRDHFEKLGMELIRYPIVSQEMLEAIIATVFDVALENVKYQDIYADLAKLLSAKAEQWSKNYLQVRELDDKQGPAGAGWYYDVSGGQGEWQGPFDSEHLANKEGGRVSNFKRLLLNRCQAEFQRENQYEDIEAEEQDDEQLRASRGTAITPQEDLELRIRAQARTEKRAGIKKRIMANISFIGQLYVAGTLTAPILYICISKLLNNGAIDNIDPDNVEALIRLLNLTGALLEKDEKEGRATLSMGVFFEFIERLSKQARLESRLRFLLQDLMELRSNKWKLTGAAAAVERSTRTLTLKEAQEAIAREEIEEKKRLMESNPGKNVQGIGTSARSMRSSIGGQDVRNQGGQSGSGRPGGRPQTNLAKSRTGNTTPTSGSSTPGGNDNNAGGESEWQTVGRPAGRGGRVTGAGDAGPTAASSSGGGQDTPTETSNENSANVIKALVLSGNDLVKRCKMIWEEYGRMKEMEEFDRSIQEIRTSPNFGNIFVQSLFDHGSLNEVNFRNNASTGIPYAIGKNYLIKEDIIQGLDNFMAVYKDLVADTPKQGEYTTALLIPLIQAGIVTIPDIWTSMLQGATATANNTAGVVVSNIIVAIVNGNDCPGKAGVVAVLNNEDLPLIQLTAPGKFRIRKLKDTLDKGGDIVKTSLQYSIIAVLAEHSPSIMDSLGDAKTGEELLQWVHGQSTILKASPSFARGLLAECVYGACQKVDDGEEVSATLPTVAQALTVAVSNVLSTLPETESVRKGIFILNGVQIACVSDDMFDSKELASQIFTILHKSTPDTGFGIIPINVFKGWLACTTVYSSLPPIGSSNTSTATTISTTSIYGTRENEGRSLVEAAVKGWIQGL